MVRPPSPDSHIPSLVHAWGKDLACLPQFGTALKANPASDLLVESVKTLIERHEHTSPSAYCPSFPPIGTDPRKLPNKPLHTSSHLKSLLHREPDLRRIPALNCHRLLQMKSLGSRGTPVGSKLCSPVLVIGFLVLPSLHLSTASRACASTRVWIPCWLLNHQYSLSKTRMCRA